MGGTLSDDVREIIAELDADGSGFRTREAANLLVHRVCEGGVCDDMGEPRQKVRSLMRMGAKVAVSGYRTVTNAEDRSRERVAAVALDQRDFGEVSAGWEHEWLRNYAAWEDTEDAERKMLVRMTLPEVLAVIRLKQRKAAEALAVARRLQTIVDEHPEWGDSPGMTVADVLGIAE